MTENTAIKMSLDPNKPEGNRKVLGGGKADEWNDRLGNLTVNALPIAYSKNKDVITEACLAISYGTMDMAPADPLEGILIAQLMAANEASLSMYRRAWSQPPDYVGQPRAIRELRQSKAASIGGLFHVNARSVREVRHRHPLAALKS